MKFSAATVLAAAASVQAYAYSNVTYTTEVVTAVTTYCPGPTQITYGGETYTVSEVCGSLWGGEEDENHVIGGIGDQKVDTFDGNSLLAACRASIFPICGSGLFTSYCSSDRSNS